MSPSGPRRKPGYDTVLKEVFESGSIVLDRLTRGHRIKKFLNPELPLTLDRRADLVAELDNNRLLHLELQAANDAEMGFRQGIYALLIGRKYRLPVDSAVVFTGDEPMRMESELDIGSVHVEYRLVDIRSFQAEELMRSERSGDLALAMLASGGTEQFHDIVRRAARLGRPARGKVLAQMAVLSGLRGLTGRLRMELRSLKSVMIELEQNEIIRGFMEGAEAKGIEKGRKEGLKEGLKEGRQEGHEEGRKVALVAALTGLIRARFGAVPKWASSRISGATPAQLDRWVLKVVQAESVEGVIGRR